MMRCLSILVCNTCMVDIAVYVYSWLYVALDKYTSALGLAVFFSFFKRETPKTELEFFSLNDTMRQNMSHSVSHVP